MSNSDLTVIILTFNEILHIERSIKSAQRVAREVIVIDSESTDATVELAESLGAKVFCHPFVNHASQLNWALDNIPLNTNWVMRLDADEYMDDELLALLPDALHNASAEVSGYEINRAINFLGRRILHGGMMPMRVLRVWRIGLAHCEQRWMDEHMILGSGRIERIKGNIVDDNLNHLSWWAEKHNRYASREAVDLLLMRQHSIEREDSAKGLATQARRKRWLKERVYSRLPLGFRPWLYFLFRVIIRRGFLDGYRGLMFHTIQGLWYRLLVDAKVMEVEHVMRRDGLALQPAVQSVLGIDLNEMPITGLPIEIGE